MTTATTITDSQIRTLRDEAATAGDDALVNLCNAALGLAESWMVNEAREQCAKAIAARIAKTATVTHAGHTFTATVIDGRVTVSQNGVWAGEGRYTSHGIEDCPAVLGDDEDGSEEIYRLLDAALATDDHGRWVYVMAGDDSDFGVIRRVDGDRAEVAWSTEVVTWIDRAELVLCADRSEAEAAVDEAIRNA